jgi:nickel superoxide dismutase
MKPLQIVELTLAFAFVSTLSLLTQTADAHCQVPCGIYDDSARLQNMLEDAQTVGKATAKLAELAGKQDAQSINQATRWVLNKEQHAQRIISTISDYYLTQRVKPSQADYRQRLVKHHAVIIAAMQAKQHADHQYATTLYETIEALTAYYPPHHH